MNVQNKFKSNVLRKLKLLFLFCSMGFTLFAQNKTVTGTVISAEDNEPLVGVTVMVKGETIGAVTNLDGKYSIIMPKNDAVLVFSMVGMTKQEISPGNNSTVNVTMTSDSKLLSEVVVTGYTSEKKADITGAVSVVKMKDILSIPQISEERCKNPIYLLASHSCDTPVAQL